MHFPGLPETKVDIEKKVPFFGLAVLGHVEFREVGRFFDGFRYCLSTGWDSMVMILMRLEGPNFSQASERVGKCWEVSCICFREWNCTAQAVVNGTHAKFVRWPDGYDVQVADW